MNIAVYMEHMGGARTHEYRCIYGAHTSPVSSECSVTQYIELSDALENMTVEFLLCRYDKLSAPV